MSSNPLVSPLEVDKPAMYKLLLESIVILDDFSVFEPPKNAYEEYTPVLVLSWNSNKSSPPCPISPAPSPYIIDPLIMISESKSTLEFP